MSGNPRSYIRKTWWTATAERPSDLRFELRFRVVYWPLWEASPQIPSGPPLTPPLTRPSHVHVGLSHMQAGNAAIFHVTGVPGQFPQII